MNDQFEPVDPGDSDEDPVLAAAGAQLRHESRALAPSTIEAAVLRRRSRRLGALVAGSLAAVVLLAGLLVVRRDSGSTTRAAASKPGAPSSSQVDRVLASLAPQPVDPTQVKLVSTVSTFPGCDALIGDLRKVGAQHVGSQGFGAFGEFTTVGSRILTPYGPNGPDAALPRNDYKPKVTGQAAAADGTTLGTNVQVEGVDELDNVKAAGKLIYDLDGKGNLRITDATTLHVLSTLDVTPSAPMSSNDGGGPPQVSQLLVADGKVAIFGTETEVSKPVKGDPSATQATTGFMTVTFVDATDPAKPTITDRVRVEGSLVSARLVNGEIRLVTTSNMADLGFVMPTTPTSVAKALDRNRRSVASSTAADWIPDWQRKGGKPTPLVPCDRVHVPDTFSGVAMTSMVTFPLGTGRFDPSGTSILAPATTLYAGLDKVAISSQVWVDPIDRTRLKFENWQTAIHEFTFAKGAAPDYVGSGIVDGSTVGQFAFGEIGKAIGVVTTKGTPWEQDPKAAVDLTVLSPDGKGKLVDTAKVDNLSDGKGGVTAVRFVDGRVLVSDGTFGRRIDVIDVSDPAKPRRAGSLALSGSVGYFHPLPDHQALLIGSRTDQVGEGQNQRSRSWVRAQLLDVSNADAPAHRQHVGAAVVGRPGRAGPPRLHVLARSSRWRCGGSRTPRAGPTRGRTTRRCSAPMARSARSPCPSPTSRTPWPRRPRPSTSPTPMRSS